MVDYLHNLTPGELVHRRNLLLNQFGRFELEFDSRRSENKLLVKGSEIRWESASSVHPTQQKGHLLARIISPELGFNIHTFRVFKRQIEGGGVDGAYHTHGDAVKYYLEGEGKEIIGDEEYEVKAGDMAFIPANIWHGTENTGEGPMVFVAFHQLPGTHLPVPAPWQYAASDIAGRGDLFTFLEQVSDEEPASLDSASLYSRRQHFLHELGVLDAEFNLRRQEHRYVLSQRDIPKELSFDGAIPLISAELGFDIYALQVSIREVPAGYRDSGFHAHGESVHYILSGQGTQRVNDEELPIESGDLVFIPLGAGHGIINSGNEPLRFLVAEQTPGVYLQRPAPWSEPS